MSASTSYPATQITARQEKMMATAATLCAVAKTSEPKDRVEAQVFSQMTVVLECLVRPTPVWDRRQRRQPDEKGPTAGLGHHPQCQLIPHKPLHQMATQRLHHRLHPGDKTKLGAPVVSRFAAACLHIAQAKFAKARTALTFGCGRCVNHPSAHGLYVQKNYAKHTDKPRKTYITKRLVSRHYTNGLFN